MTKVYPGSVTVSNRLVTTEALVSAGSSEIMGLMQPANSIIENIFVRVLEAPTIASGNIMLEIGTESDDPDNIVTDAAGSDNILDGGTTLPVGTIFDLTSATGSTFNTYGKATGNASSETASDIVTVDTQIYMKWTTSTAVTTAGKFEVSFVYRVFE
tara:strand:- start:54 stop:524 length:471 start_codon:yes stop_codon:yes gene_type:complete